MVKNTTVLLILLLSVNISYAREVIYEKATFAGGCFWCMEPPFEKLVGVKEAISGYSGGDRVNPIYEDVAGGKTKHREAVQITYNPKLVSYERLLEIFWQNIDPTDNNGQFVDRGKQYAPGIFFHNEKQKNLALDSLKKLKSLKKFKKEINTEILKLKNFYPAEEYHQDYYKKSLITKTKYKYYRNASGRDDFIEKYWKENETFLNTKKYSKLSKKELKKTLTPLQYEVTQKEGTEPPFKNDFWNNKKDGIYVDIVSGEPLFSSKDKYKSGTGWPSFTKPINSNYIIEKADYKLGTLRVEVRSRYGDSHLGHVFKDGPKPYGMRYCINSASLKFIPKKDLFDKGYSEYIKLFQ